MPSLRQRVDEVIDAFAAATAAPIAAVPVREGGRQERDFIAAGRQNILEVAVDDPANEIDIQMKDDSRVLRDAE
jgi:hypothetical protein